MSRSISHQLFDNMEKRLNQVEAILHQLSVIDKEKDKEILHEAIQATLKIIGEYTEAERVFVFDRIGETKTEYTNSYEWCAEGVEPQMEYLQHVPSIMMPYWNETFEKGASIVIPDLEEIADQMPSEYNMLKIQDVHSEIAVPIFYKDRLTGFIGLDNPSMKDQKLLLQLLNLVGNHLGSNRENIRMMNLLKKKQRILENSLQIQERERNILNVLCYEYTSVYMVDLQAD